MIEQPLAVARVLAKGFVRVDQRKVRGLVNLDAAVTVRSPASSFVHVVVTLVTLIADAVRAVGAVIAKIRKRRRGSGPTSAIRPRTR
jgi:hypothetical protein